MVRTLSFASATLALAVIVAITTGLAGGGARAQSDEPEVLSRDSIWNDPEIGIDWPIDFEPLLAAKDAAGKRLSEAEVFA